MALEMVQRDGGGEFSSEIANGLKWLADHQNADGGWGDTTKSFSNISTTMLARAVFHATKTKDQYASIVNNAIAWIDQAGGVPALIARYGKDKTFSIPILTHCALAGLVEWREVQALPFELACLPARFYKTVRLPVVSYALPALIAIGQVRHHHKKTWNPITRFLRWLAKKPSLKVLERIQPENGGFLEAAPLTSFVTMSLAGMGLSNHPVAKLGVEFLLSSIRPDGSWPIDTNLSIWTTTLSINALGEDLPEDAKPYLRAWLLYQQYKQVHPYTNADPGGWAWTDLPGGVPDADDTPGAMLALLELEKSSGGTGSLSASADTGDADRSHTGRQAASGTRQEVQEVIDRGIGWLLDLQNRDGGFPTFCKGWGALPFDRSAPDITAHCLRAILAWGRQPGQPHDPAMVIFDREKLTNAIARGFLYLEKQQQEDGSWLPLWFGCQQAPNEENPTYGTARVLAVYRDAKSLAEPCAVRGVQWLKDNQNPDGGWGGVLGAPSSVEETALAVDVLLSWEPKGEQTKRGLEWLLDRVESGTHRETTPIGFYFAKLWYFEKLYPQIFTVGTLRRAVQTFQNQPKNPDAKHQTPASVFPTHAPDESPL